MGGAMEHKESAEEQWPLKTEHPARKHIYW